MSFKNVAIIGAGGNLGPVILEALVPHFTVTVVSRESSKSTFPSSVKVAKIADNYPFADLVNILKGQDVVVSTVSGSVLADQVNLIDAAAEAGVKRFIPGEFGDDTRDAAESDIPLFKVKSDILKHLQSKSSQGMAWTAIACSAFFDWGLAVGFLRINVKNKTAQVLDAGDDKYPVTNLKTVGIAVANALLRPEETKNRFLLIQSFYVSSNEIIAELEKASGSKFEVQKLDSKEFKAEAQRKMQGPEFIDGLYGAVYVSVVNTPDFRNKAEDFANELLGLPAENFEETIKRVVAESQ